MSSSIQLIVVLGEGSKTAPHFNFFHYGGHVVCFIARIMSKNPTNDIKGDDKTKMKEKLIYIS